MTSKVDDLEWNRSFWMDTINDEFGYWLPCRAVIYMMSGLYSVIPMDDDDRDDDRLTEKLMISLLNGMYQQTFKRMADNIKGGKITEVKCCELLTEEGKQIGEVLKKQGWTWNKCKEVDLTHATYGN
jgi:hypothetical protein